GSLHESFELSAAIFVVPEHVETCETGAQQNVFAGTGQLSRAAHRLRQAGATRMGHAEGGAVERQLGARLADQHDMFYLPRDAVREAREIYTTCFTCPAMRCAKPARSPPFDLPPAISTTEALNPARAAST